MPGATDLAILLRSIKPSLDDAEYVFATVPGDVEADAICRFREREGLTLILRRDEAERRGIAYTYPCRRITLNVHSSLEAVGFLATIAAALARESIGVNVVSACFHDHLFVSSDSASRAMEVLGGLSGSPAASHSNSPD